MPPKTPQAGLKIRIVTDELATDDIKCTCGGRPADGQSTVYCINCEKYLHQKCILGENKDFSKVDVSRGYICRTCQTTRRSGAAKIGYSNRKAGVPSRRSRDTPRSAAKSTGSGGTFDSPLALKGNLKSSVGLSLGSSAPSLLSMGNKKFKLPNSPLTPSTGTGTTPKKAKKRVKKEDENDEDVFGDDQDVDSDDLPLTAISTRTRKRKRETGLDKALLDVIEKIKHSHDKKDVFCKCKDGPAGTMCEYIICVRCHNLQHTICGPAADPEQDKIGKGLLCEDCHAVRSVKVVRFGRHVQRAQSARKKFLIEAEAKAAITRNTKLNDLIANHFWREYCNLPNTQAAEAVIELTSTYFNDGKMLPIHPAPAKWVQEVNAAVKLLCGKENKQMLMQIAGKDREGLALDQPVQCRRDLGELAVLSVHFGPFKGRKAELGVLSEVLGMAQKGEFWKG